MKDFLIRLGLVCHWAGFVFGIFSAFMSISYGGITIPSIFISAGIFVGCNSIGYLLRYVMVGGDIKFFPHHR